MVPIWKCVGLTPIWSIFLMFIILLTGVRYKTVLILMIGTSDLVPCTPIW